MLDFVSVQDGTDMVLVSQEYINNLRRALDAERIRAKELEGDVQRMREELSLLKVREATGYRPDSSLNMPFLVRACLLCRESGKSRSRRQRGSNKRVYSRST